jgi:hypothetical protein
MSQSPFVLPSVDRDPMPWDDAVAAALGYARGRRGLSVKTPTYPQGHTVPVPAYAYETYDCIPPSKEPGITYWDVLVVNGLNGRLGQKEIEALKDAGGRAEKYIAAALELAGNRAFWELPEAEVLSNPPEGSAGDALKAAWAEFMGTAHVDVARTHKVLHHKHPRHFPLIDGKTAPRLEQHTESGGVRLWAVIHRELRANESQFAALEAVIEGLLVSGGGVRLTRLRLHDVLLWLSASKNMADAITAGRSTREWQTFLEGDVG